MSFMHVFCTFVFAPVHCMFHMERCSRNTPIIINPKENERGKTKHGAERGRGAERELERVGRLRSGEGWRERERE